MVALIFRYGESQFSYGFVCVWHNSFTSWGNILWSTTLSFCGQPQTHYVINPTPVLCNLFTKYFTVNNTPLLLSNAPPFCGQQYTILAKKRGVKLPSNLTPFEQIKCVQQQTNFCSDTLLFWGFGWRGCHAAQLLKTSINFSKKHWVC